MTEAVAGEHRSAGSESARMVESRHVTPGSDLGLEKGRSKQNAPDTKNSATVGNRACEIGYVLLQVFDMAGQNSCHRCSEPNDVTDDVMGGIGKIKNPGNQSVECDWNGTRWREREMTRKIRGIGAEADKSKGYGKKQEEIELERKENGKGRERKRKHAGTEGIVKKWVGNGRGLEMKGKDGKKSENGKKEEMRGKKVEKGRKERREWKKRKEGMEQRKERKDKMEQKGERKNEGERRGKGISKGRKKEKGRKGRREWTKGRKERKK